MVVRSAGNGGTPCAVTAAGLAARRAHAAVPAEAPDLDHALLGKRYRSSSGCVAGDLELT
ncbi:MAG: hypothetical protein JWN46_1134 [Acidimicrobiales bacterium]|nr:hypothetical protein [Acidimicrobiales bacterium]